jgi:hypothetical protein
MYLLVHTLFIYEECVLRETTLNSNFKLQLNPVPMNTFTSTRSQLIAELLDSHLSFEAVRATSTWDELTCLEQMTMEDLMDM